MPRYRLVDWDGYYKDFEGEMEDGLARDMLISLSGTPGGIKLYNMDDPLQVVIAPDGEFTVDSEWHADR